MAAVVYSVVATSQHCLDRRDCETVPLATCHFPCRQNRFLAVQRDRCFDLESLGSAVLDRLGTSKSLESAGSFPHFLRPGRTRGQDLPSDLVQVRTTGWLTLQLLPDWQHYCHGGWLGHAENLIHQGDRGASPTGSTLARRWVCQHRAQSDGAGSPLARRPRWQRRP